ncbi:MAG: RNB domain-containing ribonuclease [Actinomyces sp.]|nr:MAG: RNB domain-containing ribonuclease [Actinomyces sp.]
MPRPRLLCPPDLARVRRELDRIRHELGIPDAFDPAVLAAADAAVAAGPTVPPGADPRRRDATDLPLVTIDPRGSTDLDQAFTAARRGAGHRVHYAIADVAAFVAPDDPVDREARRRGVTLYAPDRRTPLHPPVLGDGAASLRASEVRPALLWTIDLDDTGEIGDARLERAWVRNRAELSYADAQERIDAMGADADDPLAVLREIGQRRLALEERRDAVHLALPDQEVVEGPDGRIELRYDVSRPVEDWNAQISLLTGIAAARIMLDAGIGLLRTLPPPDHRTVAALRRSARALGIEWPDTWSYARRIRTLRPDTPAAIALLAQAARALRGAGYTVIDDGVPPERLVHSAIASTYAHVTAPLRRLCDRYTNEVVLAVCAGREAPTWATGMLDELPRIMARARHLDGQLDRAVVDLMEALLLEPHVGETFRAVVVDTEERRGHHRARIQLRDPAVIARMDDGRVRPGTEIGVALVAVDVTARSVTFRPDGSAGAGADVSG